MTYFVLALLTAFLTSLWIVASVRGENNWAFDTTLIGAQKFHTKPVPRIGGVVVFTALSTASLAMWWMGELELRNLAALLMCGTPAFAVGLLEDITKKINPNTRLLAICLSAFLAWAVLDVAITRVDIPVVDTALRFMFPAMLLTVFAVAGIANAVNIIDGFHGLALMSSCLMFAAIGLVAYQTQDLLVMTTAMACVGSLLGLFVWNYPNGRIFLGDGGAYFVGFMLAQCGIMLFHRNSEVSAWFAILVLAYPTTETLFSIYRKRLLRKISPMHPDRAHFHMLVFGRVVPRIDSHGHLLSRDERNARTAPYLWLLTMTSLVPAVAFYDNPAALMTCAVAFVAGYVFLYRRLVQFKPVPMPFGRKVTRRVLRS